MAKRHADEKRKRAVPTEAEPQKTGEAAAPPLTDEALGRVTGGYIGETEKNLRQ